jgi:hypothetical protein
MPDSTSGIACHPEDISIVANDTEEHTKWKINVYEL